MRRFSVKIMFDGRAMLNLGCGYYVDRNWNNIDFSLLLRLGKIRGLARLLACFNILSDERYNRLKQADPDTIVWDLRKGIPFDRDIFDVIYHSHFLEHLERRAAQVFLLECHRVLKPGGILRVVVPDLEIIVREYLYRVNGLYKEPERYRETELSALHEQSIERLFDQMVLKWPGATQKQKRAVGFLEHIVRGDADRVGERHHWMYDYYSLSRLLARVGFRDIRRMDAKTSQITGWSNFDIDVDSDGNPVKSRSLYVEATK